MKTMLNWLRRLFRNEPPPDELQAELRDWRIVKAINDETNEAAVFRLRIRKPPLGNIDAFRTAVRVTWPYTSDSPMPTKDVQAQQNAFDIALDELSGGNGYAELVQVSTGNGVKEWLYYTTDVEAFGASFNRLLEGHPRYPVTLQFEQDPEWRIWGDFVESVEDRTEL